MKSNAGPVGRGRLTEPLMKDAATTVRYTAFPHSTRSQAIVLLRAMSAFGGKADIGSARQNDAFDPFRHFERSFAVAHNH